MRAANRKRTSLRHRARPAVDKVPAANAAKPDADARPAADAPGPEKPPAAAIQKTKQDQRELTKPMTNPELAKLDAEANRATLERIYREFYANGKRKTSEETALDKQLETLYSIMGRGSGAYVRTTITAEEFNAFSKRENATVTAQKMGSKAEKSYAERLAAYEESQKKYAERMKQWAEDKSRWQEAVRALRPDEKPPPEPAEPAKPTGTRPKKPPATLQEALELGDYFHVHNDKSGKLRGGKTGRARRIIVNVNSQHAGLKVAKSVGDLFDDDNVAPYLREYKIFLTQAKARNNATAKHDKLVIYYRVPHSAKGDDDPVGDRIVAAIKAAKLDAAEVGGEFAPFYARVDAGIAWAEEPKYFVDSLKGSFTESREQIIAGVIRNAAEVDDSEAFVNLVGKALQDNFVDPKTPHRHLPGNPPKPKQRAQPAEAAAPPLPPDPPAGPPEPPPDPMPESQQATTTPPTRSRKPAAKISTNSVLT